MAHYALLDRNNVVVQVITGVDENEGVHDWELFYTQETRLTAKRTSYNTRGGQYWVQDENGNRVLGPDQSKAFRKNYAGIDYVYDAQRDAFIAPKPFDSWQLNEQSCLWEAPVAVPNDGKSYRWDEPNLTWIAIE